MTLWTDRALHRLWLCGACIGFIFSGAAVMRAFAADDFARWRAHAPFTIARAVPESALRALMPDAWTRGGGPDDKALHYYAGYCGFNAAAIVVLTVRARRVRAALAPFAAFATEPEHQYGRKVIAIAACTIVLTFHTKAYAGFWFPGIVGWVEHNPAPNFEPRGGEPEPVADLRGVSPAVTAALQRSIRAGNARHFESPGQLAGTALLLHFANGQVEPGTWGLTSLVFPEYVFGIADGRFTHADVLLRVIRHTLHLRQQGKRFLLPTVLSYPPHSRFTPMPYNEYPRAAELRAVSAWNLTIAIDGHDRVRLIAAMPLASTDAR